MVLARAALGSFLLVGTSNAFAPMRPSSGMATLKDAAPAEPAAEESSGMKKSIKYLGDSDKEPASVALSSQASYSAFKEAMGFNYLVAADGEAGLYVHFDDLNDGVTYKPIFKKPKGPKTVEDELKDITFTKPKIPDLSQNLVARDEAKSKVIRYLQNCESRDRAVLDNVGKYALLGISGVKGIGKSEILGQICSSWATEALDRAETLYVTYNGGGAGRDYCLFPDGDKLKYEDAFGYLLLVACGVLEETAVQVPFGKAMKCVVEKFCGNDETLVICVDEIIELNKGKEYKPGEWSPAAYTMSALMKLQDNRKGKIIFVFSGILDSMFTALKSLSGRAVIPLPLTLIPLRTVFSNLISAKLRPFANEPAVNQLIVSCAGHPRATVDGLEEGTTYWTQQKGATAANITTQEILTARSFIVNQTCKFDTSYLTDDILKLWFDCLKPISFDMREKFLAEGILHSITNGSETVEFLFPLLLQDWAQKNQASTFGFHLHGLFNADLVLDADNEKSMEAVMYHYEALLRKATEGKFFPLQSFYNTPHVANSLKYKQLKSIIVENSIDCVAYVDDFKNMEEIIRLLNVGYIVVSKKHSEVGVEYLVPYSSNDKLCVACVQCKFVQTSTNWAKIKEKMLTAVSGLESKNVEYFPVVYTTVDQKTLFESTYGDGVYFVEADLYNFTKRMGILRMHTMKLGGRLLSSHPYLSITA